MSGSRTRVSARLVGICAVFLATAFATQAHAAVEGQLGILDTSGTNPATGAAWAAGDTYRLVFVSSTRSDAQSADIADYNAHVQAAADTSTIPELGTVTWYAIGSTATVDAVDNTHTTGTDPDGAFFLVDGTTVVASSIADFWDGAHAAAMDRTEKNEAAVIHDGAWGPWKGTWTGTNTAGYAAACLGGIADPTVGLAQDSSSLWIARGTGPKTSLAYLYGMSEVLTVQPILWTPAEIPTELWLDAADAATITEAGGLVSQWDDKSGKANHATQGTAANQPTTASRTIGGMNALDFTGDKLGLSSLDMLGRAVFAVVEVDSAAIGQILAHDAVNVQLRVDDVGRIQYAAATPRYAGNPPSSGTISTITPAVVGYLLGGTMQYSINGAFEDTLVVDGGSGSTAYNQIGMRQASDEPFDGLIGEIVVTDSMPDEATRQRIEGYLAWKWGLEGDLPAEHPYKSAPPSSAGPALGWDYHAWTGDADSGIDSAYVYTAAHCFGDNHASVTVNGVTFVGSYDRSGTGWDVGATMPSNWGGDDDAALTGLSEDLGEEFIYNGNPATITLSGLTIGQDYKVSLFSVAWGPPGGRFQTFSSDGNDLVLDQDLYGENNGIVITYTYVAAGTTQVITITPATASTFHMYALANRETTPPNPPPVVTLDAPTEGEAFASGVPSIGLQATAADDGAVMAVEFRANGAWIGDGVFTDPTWDFTWPTPPDGEYALTAFATDDEGATTESLPVNITAGTVITVSATDATATENGDGGVFTITRTAPDNTGDIVVDFTMTGAAVEGAGNDYTLDPSGSATIPSGQWTATVTLTTVNDEVYEPDEDAIITLDSTDVGTLGLSVTATITIADDDTPLPLTMSGCVLWLDGRDIDGDGSMDSYTDGEALTAWVDKSGAGNDATGTGSFEATGVVGKPSVHFTTAQYMATATAFSNPFTMVTLSRQTGVFNDCVIGSNSTIWLLGYFGGTRDDMYAGGWVLNGTTACDTDPHIYSVTQSGSLTTFYEGTTQLASNGNGNTAVGSVQLNGYQHTNDRSDCEIAEILIYDRVLTGPELTSLNDFLVDKYWNPSPVVTWNTPAAGSYPSGTDFSGANELSVNATDDTAVTGVVFKQNGIVIPGTPTQAGDTWTLDWMGPADGSYTLTAEATDDAAGVGVSPDLDIIVGSAIDIAKTFSAAEPATNGLFTLTRLGDKSQAIDVNISVAGTAVSGDDYAALPATVHFDIDQTTARLEVLVIDDADSDMGETVEVTIAAGAGYGPGDTPTAMMTIGDDDPDPSLVAYWKLDHDGPSDLVAYDAAGANDGTLINGTSWTTNGQVDGALGFDGNVSYVIAPDLGFSGSMSVSVAAWIWVDPSTPRVKNNIFGFGRSVNSEAFSFMVQGDGEFNFSFYFNDLVVNVPNYYGTWVHVAAVYDAVALKQYVYFEGVEAGQRTPGVPNFYSSSCRIGGFNSEYFKGFIDDVRVYNRPLDAEDVLAIYNSTSDTPIAATITSIAPDFGPETGGTPVTITGANFTLETEATVGLTGEPLLNPVVVNDTTITGEMPPAPGPLGRGNIAGVPEGPPGLVTFDVTATPMSGPPITQEFSISVLELGITSPESMPFAYLGFYYSQTLAAGGGTPPYTWTITDGQLPPGLYVVAAGPTTGAIDGRPQYAGRYEFTVGVEDSLGLTGSRDYAIDVFESHADGHVMAEIYDDVAGRTVADLTGAAAFPGNPTAREALSELAWDPGMAADRGVRVRGYVHAPETGTYNIKLTADDSAEFRLSADQRPDRAQLLVENFPGSDFTEATVDLLAGGTYYFEVLHKDSTVDPIHVTSGFRVGWTLPVSAIEQPTIPGQYLSPFLDATAPPTPPGPVTGLRNYEEAVLASGPVVYYRLNEAGNPATVVNIGTGGPDWDGTVAATLTFGAEAAYASLGTAIDSTGANNGYIWSGLTEDISDHDSDIDYSDLLLCQNASMEFWIKVQPGVDGGGQMASGIIEWGDCAFIDATDSQIGIHAGYTSHAWSGAMNDGQWHYVLLTYDAALHLVWVYLDGDHAPKAQGDLTTNPYYNVGSSLLSWFNKLDEGMEAQYDEIAIYDRVLSGSEGRAHYLMAQNSAPSVTWVTPAEGNYAAPHDFVDANGTILKVTTTDLEGYPVTGVDFYANDQLIGTAPEASGSTTWTFEWFGVPQGDYVLTAIATDDGNGGSLPLATGVSPDLNVSVGTAVNIDATENAQEPSHDGLFTVTRSDVDAADPLVVDYVVTGTAEADQDYTALAGTVSILANETTATIDVEVIADILDEGEETVVVTIVAGAGYEPGVAPSATVTIAPGATVTVVATDAIAMEEDPANTGEFTVTRDGVLDDPLAVNFSMAGSALGGVDYDLSGPTYELDGPMTVTIPAGVDSTTITLTVIDDATTEGNLSARLMVVPGPGCTIGNPSSAVVVIYEDDWAGDLSLRAYWKFDEGGGDTAFDSSFYGNHMTIPAYCSWEADDLQGGALRVPDAPVHADILSINNYKEVESFSGSKAITLSKSAGDAAEQYPAGKRFYSSGAVNAGNNGWFTSTGSTYNSVTHQVQDLIYNDTIVLEVNGVANLYPPGGWLTISGAALGESNRTWQIVSAADNAGATNDRTVVTIQTVYVPFGSDIEIQEEPGTDATCTIGNTVISTNEDTVNETSSDAVLAGLIALEASAGDVTADYPPDSWIIVTASGDVRNLGSHQVLGSSFDGTLTSVAVSAALSYVADDPGNVTRFPIADDWAGWTPVEMTIDWRVKVFTDYRYNSVCTDGSEGLSCAAGLGRPGHFADNMEMGERLFTYLGWWNFMKKGQWEHYTWTYQHLQFNDPRYGLSRFYRNGELVIADGGARPSPPWAFINLRGDAAYGDFRIYDRALSEEEIVGMHDPSLLDGPPGMRWLSPAEGMYPPGSDFTLSVALTGAGSGVSKVVFKQNGIMIGEAAQTLPGTWTLDWNNVPAGGYGITAEATHVGGTVSVSDTLLVSTGDEVFVTTIDAQAAESDADTNPGVFRITNSGAVATDVTFIMDGGDGVTPGDYTISSAATLTPVGAGWFVTVSESSYVDIELRPVQDGDDTEEDEVVTLSIAGSTNTLIGSPATAAVNMLDYDPFLRALWRFDEQNGPIAYDRSGHGNV